MSNWGTALMGGLNGGAKAVNTVLDERRKDERQDAVLQKKETIQQRRDIRLQVYKIDIARMGLKPAVPTNPELLTKFDENGNAVQETWQDGKRIDAMVGRKPTKGGKAGAGDKPTNWAALAKTAYPDDPYSITRVAAVAERLKEKNQDLGDSQIFFEARKFVDDNPRASQDEIDDILKGMPDGFLGMGDTDNKKVARAVKRDELIDRGRSIEPVAPKSNQRPVAPKEAKTNPDVLMVFLKDNFSGVRSEADMLAEVQARFPKYKSNASSDKKSLMSATKQAQPKRTKPQLKTELKDVLAKISKLPNKYSGVGRNKIRSKDFQLLYRQQMDLESKIKDYETEEYDKERYGNNRRGR